MTKEECFKKAQLIIDIVIGFKEHKFKSKSNFTYNERMHEYCMDSNSDDTRSVIVYNIDPLDNSGYDDVINYICNNPLCTTIRTAKNETISYNFSIEDLPLKWDEETVFQYSTIHTERVLDAMMIMWYIIKNYNEHFYFDLDYFDMCKEYL